MNRFLCALVFVVAASCMLPSAEGAGPMTNPTDWDSAVMLNDGNDVTLYLDKYHGECMQDFVVEVWFEVRFSGARVELDNDNEFPTNAFLDVRRRLYMPARPDAVPRGCYDFLPGMTLDYAKICWHAGHMAAYDGWKPTDVKQRLHRPQFPGDPLPIL